MRSRIVAVILAFALLAACGGGGGGGSSGSKVLSPAELPVVSMTRVGAIGTGHDGWGGLPAHTDGLAVGRGITNFRDPRGVFVGDDGVIYVADTFHARIVRWGGNGAPLGWIGGEQEGWRTDDVPKFHFLGEEELEFRRPVDVHVDGAGRMYVVDFENHRVCRWGPDGTFEGWLGGGHDGWSTGDAPPLPGSGFGELDLTYFSDVFVDDDGDIYVSERRRVSRFGADGRPLGWIGGGKDGWHQTAFPTSQDVSEGRTLWNPAGIHVGGDGTILVAEMSHHRVSRWSADGVFLGWIGGGVAGWQTGPAPESGRGLSEFHNPVDVGVDGDGAIYVLGHGTSSVAKWTADGVPVGWLGGGVNGWHEEPTPTAGNELTSFENPWGFHVAADGTITVADSANQRICRWSADGVALGWLGAGEPGWHTGDPAYIKSYDQRRFSGASGVAVDAAGNVYVAEAWNHRVSKYDAAGTSLGWIGGGDDGWRTGKAPWGTGTDVRSFSGPTDVGVDAAGNIYVVDGSPTGRICKWGPDGHAIGQVRYGVDETWSREDVPWLGGSIGPDGRSICVYPDGSFLLTAGAKILKHGADGRFMGGLGGGRDGWHQGSFPPGLDWRSARSLSDIAVDSEGNIYVTDTTLDRVQKWSSDGRPLGWLGGGGAGFKMREVRYRVDDDEEWNEDDGATDTRFRNPRGIVVAGDGTILVADEGNERIVRWDRHGNAGGEILSGYARIALDGAGDLYALDDQGPDVVVKWILDW